MADASTPGRGERRGPDRRQGDEPFVGSDRRGGERRSGEDRRVQARTRLTH